MKDKSTNQKSGMGGNNFEEEFGQVLFFISLTPQYVPRVTELEPDRRLQKFSLRGQTWFDKKSELTFRMELRLRARATRGFFS